MEQAKLKDYFAGWPAMRLGKPAEKAKLIKPETYLGLKAKPWFKLALHRRIAESQKCPTVL
jgi:hypothetical protein